MNFSVGGVIDIQTTITKRLPVAVALKFTVHVVQSFIKGHRKSGVISIKHSRDMTSRINVHFLPVSATICILCVCVWCGVCVCVWCVCMYVCMYVCNAW